jgi:hypothetical protein
MRTCVCATTAYFDPRHRDVTEERSRHGQRPGEQPRAPTLPIRRVVGPADVGALAVHLMTNTTITGATCDIEGGQQLVAGS